MIVDRLIVGDDGNDPELTEGRQRYAELIDAAERIEEPHLCCVLTPGATHLWTNLADRSAEEMLSLGVDLVFFFVDQIAGTQGREKAALWLMDAISACG